MRKKSNHTAADTAASMPATRFPAAATATITRTRMSAASVFGMLARNGARTAVTASGAASPASTAARSRLRRLAMLIPAKPRSSALNSLLRA